MVERRGVKKEDGDAGTRIEVVEAGSGRKVGVRCHRNYLRGLGEDKTTPASLERLAGDCNGEAFPALAKHEEQAGTLYRLFP